MKVVIAHKSREPRVVDLPEPKGGRGFLVVRISHSAVVLPSELQTIRDAPSLVRPGEDGVPLGSTASGTIIEVGEGVTTLKAGLRVAVAGSPFVYHGGHLVVPEELTVELPKKVNHEEGAFAGPGAKALSWLRAGRLQIGEVTVIFGAELPGLIAAQIVRAAGGIPFLIDDSEFRLSKARAIGLTHAYTPRDTDLAGDLAAATGNAGADLAVCTLGNRLKDYETAVKFLREDGRIVLGAQVGERIDPDRLRDKRIELCYPSGSRDPRWTRRENMSCFCQLLADRKVQITPLVTDRLPIERAPLVYEKAGRGGDGMLGVVLTF